MTCLAFRNKTIENSNFEEFLLFIKQEAEYDKYFVKKAINWVLRQIGKRNLYLNKKAIKTAKEILKINSKSAQ